MRKCFTSSFNFHGMDSIRCMYHVILKFTNLNSWLIFTHSLYVSKKPCHHLLSDNNAHILCKEWLKSCNLSYFMQGSLSVSQSELHPMRIKFPYSLVCVLSLTRYIYAQKINERDLLHAHSSVGVSYLHADPQCIYSSWDSFFKDDRNNKVYLCTKAKRNNIYK